jgi:hemoglobin
MNTELQTTTLQDICNRKDLEHLMRAFYMTVIGDEVIGYLFTDVANIDLKRHLPIIVDFWETVVFGTQKYKGNPMTVHQHLHGKSPLRVEHFTRWMEVFCAAVDADFSGTAAEMVKARAQGIAAVMSAKLLSGNFDNSDNAIEIQMP